jgi:Flp pilus assembly protein TadD
MEVDLQDLPGLFVAGFLLLHAVIGIHELGHWFAGGIAGFRLNAFRIGSGPTLVRFKRGQCVFSWSLFPTHGRVHVLPSPRSYSVLWQSSFLLGGVGAEIACAALAWILIRPEPVWSYIWEMPLGRYLLFLAGFDVLYTAVFSLWPARSYSAGELRPNDGFQLLQLWKERLRLPERRQFLLDTTALGQLMAGPAKDQATTRIKELLLKYPDSISLLNASMQFQAQQGDVEGAGRTLDTRLQQEPADSPNRVPLLDQYVSLLLAHGRGDWVSEADRLSYDALLLAPESVTLRGTRGAVLAELGRNAEARRLLNDVLAHTESDVDRVYCHIYLAWLDAQEGRRSAAIDNLERAKTMGVAIGALPRLETKIRTILDQPSAN